MDPTLILMLAALAVLMFMMMRRNKKAQAKQQEMQSKFAPGIEVMTNYGLFGTIVSIDEDENKVVLELSPGNTATVHRQSVVKAVEPALTDEDAAAAVAPEAEASTPSATLSDEDLARLASPEPTDETPRDETPEETLKRLNGENK